MQAIIKSKLYNTETATFLRRHEDGLSQPFSLYRTDKGAFFVVRHRTGMYENDEIEIPSESLLITQLGKYLPDLYIQIYGEVEEA